MASVFCWVDLRSALPEATWEAERRLWEEGFVQRCGFIITPGTDSQIMHLHMIATVCETYICQLDQLEAAADIEPAADCEAAIDLDASH